MTAKNTGWALAYVALGTVSVACGGLVGDDATAISRTEPAPEKQPAPSPPKQSTEPSPPPRWEEPAKCDGRPECAPDEFAIEGGCTSNSPTCHDVTVCGETLGCDVVCLGACGAGERPVLHESDCAQDDGICRKTVACGREIWCTNA